MTPRVVPYTASVQSLASMDTIFSSALGIALGIGLAAATGFRIFVPLLIAGIAARFDWISLNDSFAWLESTAALVTLGSAAVFETLAYYIPGVDHALDAIASPAAVVAGIVVSAAAMTNVAPGVMWPLAIIAGGGVAGITKGSTALLRAKSGVATAGLANPVVSTAENIGAAGIAILAIVLPLLCLIVVVVVLFWAIRRITRFVAARR